MRISDWSSDVGSSDLRLVTQRTYLSGRDVEELAPDGDCRRDLRSRRRQGGGAQPFAPGRRVWEAHPPLQSLLLDRAGALPLALLLLPQLRARPDAGHDERHLPTLGSGEIGRAHV